MVPLTRKPFDGTENRPETGSGQPVWWYDQKRKRGSDRTYSGQVNHIHGVGAERLRGELADVIRDLLDWAAAQQQTDADQSIEDGEAA
ncbi:hypothetical protein [Kibdelosporangium philippinense]|uniref:hypothetical protein n=1 Tax=Kibdelosporangium philippinense TaxID=211113 RepID=UPI0035E870C2